MKSKPQTQLGSSELLTSGYKAKEIMDNSPDNVEELIDVLISEAQHLKANTLSAIEAYNRVASKLISYRFSPRDFERQILAEMHKLYDANWVKSTSGKKLSLKKILSDKTARKISPHPLFDIDFYVSQSKMDMSLIHPLEHFILIGADRGFSPHPLFDSRWYLSYYPDVAESGVSPFFHFLNNGAKEMRHPSSRFSSSRYLEAYPDVKATGMNPLVHYIQFGAAEDRQKWEV